MRPRESEYIRTSFVFLWIAACAVELLGPRSASATDASAPSLSYVPGDLVVRLSLAESERAADEIEAGRGSFHFQAITGLQVRHARPIVRVVRRPGQSRIAAFQERTEAIRSRFARRTGRGNTAPVGDSLSRLYRLSLSDRTADVEEICQRLRQVPGIEDAHPNYTMRWLTIPLPDVPYIPDDFHVADGDIWREGSWAEDRPDLYGHQLIQAIEAYNLFPDPENDPGTGTVVAVIDSGADYLHPDLAENIWVNPGEDLNGNGIVDDSDLDGLDTDSNGFIDDIRGWDFTNYVYPPQPDNSPDDYDGHGTHCAGTIAAAGGNGVGTLGVAPNAKIMPIAAGFAGGLIGVIESVEAVLYAADNGADVVSNSWEAPTLEPPAI